MKTNILKNLKRSKKGALPGLTNVFQVVGMLPRPIQLLLLIFMFSTITSFIIPFFLNFAGYHCADIDGEVKLFKVPFIQNFELVLQPVSTVIQTAVGDPIIALPDSPFPNSDKRFTIIPDACFIEQEINGTPVTGYVASCMECEVHGNIFTNFFTPLSSQICIGNGYVERDFTGIFERNLCSACTAPTGYFYNHTYCVENNACFFMIHPNVSISEITDTYQNIELHKKLLRLGAVIIQQNENEFANVQCNANKKPSLYFFMIEVFNKNIWIFSIIAGFFIWLSSIWYPLIL